MLYVGAGAGVGAGVGGVGGVASRSDRGVCSSFILPHHVEFPRFFQSQAVLKTFISAASLTVLLIASWC